MTSLDAISGLAGLTSILILFSLIPSLHIGITRYLINMLTWIKNIICGFLQNRG